MAVGRTLGVKRVADRSYGANNCSALETGSLGSLPAPAESVVELNQR